MAAELRPDERLMSWKAIAQFFERDVRTVQRWEKEEGLPVHRHLHHRRSSVYADPDELRAWWNRTAPHDAPLADAEPPADVTVSPADVAAPPDDAPATSMPPRRLRSIAIAATLAAGVLALTTASWFLRSRPTPSPGSRVVTIAGRPAEVAGAGAGPTGDFNGDGRDDLILSTPLSGQIFIVFGGRPRADATIDAIADVTVRAGATHLLSAHEAGDFNGDGIDDLAVTEYLREPESFTANGPTYLIWGRRDWPRALTLPADAGVTMRVTWPTSAGLNGCVYGRGADLNHDGLDDVLIGGVDYGPPDRRSAGGVLVFFGRRNWPATLESTTDADVDIAGAESGEALGAGCTIADFDGDGRVDLAVSAPEHTLWALRGERGRVYVFSGGRSWPRRIDARTEYDLRIDGGRPHRWLGLVRAADINGDGRADLIVARNDPGKTSFGGELRVFFGGAHRGIVTDAAADVLVEGTRAKARFGGSIGTWDLDRDGLADVIVTEPGSGTTYALYGRREWARRGRPEDFHAVALATGRRGIGLGPPAIWRLDRPADLAIVLAPNPYEDTPAGVVGVAVEPYREVKLDVRPGFEPNVILPNWVCVARVFGTSASDAVDPASLRLGGAPATQIVVQDYNGDAIPDVQATFDTSRMRLAAGAERVWIHGRTRSGLPIAGADSIVLVEEGHDLPVPAKTQNRLP